MTISRRVKSAVLATLDEAANPWLRAFPYVELASHLIDMRLSVYRSGKQWCIVLEVVEVDLSSPGHLGVRTVLYFFSNPPGCVQELSDQSFLNLTSDAPGAATFYERRVGGEFVNPRARAIRVRKRIVKLPAKSEYAKLGVDLEALPEIEKYELIRCLAGKHDGLFFATDAEISKRSGLKLARPILSLRAWRHPRHGEAPSDTETFRMLAEVVATGDPNRYQPTEEPNTHWSDWPEAEEV